MRPDWRRQRLRLRVAQPARHAQLAVERGGDWAAGATRPQGRSAVVGDLVDYGPDTLAQSLGQLADETEEFHADARVFMDRLLRRYVLDGGRLVVAHAGLKEAYHGRTSGRARAFALYSDGKTDTDGYPMHGNWTADYSGDAMVVYEHTPVERAGWVNNTICLDTGAIFGGSLPFL